MTKKKKLSTKHFILIGVLSLALIGGFGIASANLSFMDRIADKAGEILGLSLSDKIDMDFPVEENLGGSGGVFQTDWYKVGNRVTWVKSGQFADASLVLFSVPNPATGGTATSTTDLDYNDDTHMTGTSTVMNVNLDITAAATSSMAIMCGGAADSTSAPTYEMLNLALPTSTVGVFNSGQATTTSGLGVIGTGTSDEIDYRILLTHEYNYFNCVATGTTASLDSDWATVQKGLTGDTNTFNGYWSVEIMKNLQ